MKAPVVALAACAALAAWPSAARAADSLDEFVRLQVGSFTSAEQARQDARYDEVTWHIAEIWPDDTPAERWLYTESWMQEAPAPYMQRVTRLVRDTDGTITAQRYTLPEAPRYVGAWQDPGRLAALRREDLTELAGCESLIVRAGAGRFEGATSGRRCPNGHRGAAYAISRSVLTADEMLNWDRGFDADGVLKWGPEAGGYRFRRVGAAESCTQPVRMLVFGEIRDRAAFGAYAQALARSGLYPKYGGYYEAMSPVLDVLEGEPPPGRGVIVARWPCRAAALRFWNSDEYREIRKLREGIAEVEVLLLPVPPLPKGTPAPLQ